MSSYGYTNRNDPPDRVVPATRTLNEEPGSRVKAPRSAQERRIPGSLTPEDFDDLDQIAETIITPERVTTPEVLAGIVVGLEGQFESLSALSANMGELVAGVARDEDDRFRLDFDEAVATVRDETNTVRMVWGRLGSGVQEYGLAVYSANGDLILGANGLGTNVVNRPQLGDNAVGRAQIEDGEIIRAKIGDAAIGRAQIENGEIIRAKIQDAAINNAKIANVAANKILAGAIGVDRFIESTNFSAGNSGWRLSHTVAEFNDVVIRGTLEGADGTFSGDLAANVISLQNDGGTERGSLVTGDIPGGGILPTGSPSVILRTGGGSLVAGWGGLNGGFEFLQPAFAEFYQNRRGYDTTVRSVPALPVGGSGPDIGGNVVIEAEFEDFGGGSSGGGAITLRPDGSPVTIEGDLDVDGGLEVDGDFLMQGSEARLEAASIIFDTLDPVAFPGSFAEPSAGSVQGYLPITVGGILYHVPLHDPVI